MRGAEIAPAYRPGTPPRPGRRDRLRSGEVAWVTPAGDDIPVVEDAPAAAPRIGIHGYGGDVGRIRRHAFDPVTGEARAFVSGYGNAPA